MTQTDTHPTDTGEELRTVATAICKSRTCEGVNCCQWPANGGRRKCPVRDGCYDDAARDALAAMSRLTLSVGEVIYPPAPDAAGHASFTPITVRSTTSAAKTTHAGEGVVEAHIKHMVQRFLGWKLPANFNPDNGISFDPVMNKGHAFESKREPVGTNLFSADQATEMVRYMVEGLAVSKSQPADRLLADIENREARRQEILDWLQEKIGTGWECDQCGYQTYHSSSNECAECGKDFPTLHLLAFKLHASHTASQPPQSSGRTR